MTTFLRVLGCYPREVSSLALRSVDLPDPIADAGAAGQDNALHGSDELLFALASATGRRTHQVRRHTLQVLWVPAPPGWRSDCAC